jgi:serine/threonine protein kinase
VLYSHGEACWKLTDFGTTSEATSKQLCTTRYSRGTAGYRAPEIIADEARFNNKSDIFSAGCILYELCTGVKLFSNDFAIHAYANSLGPPNFPIPFDSTAWFFSTGSGLTSDTGPIQSARQFRLWHSISDRLSSYLLDMLDRDPVARPKARRLEVAWHTAIVNSEVELPLVRTVRWELYRAGLRPELEVLNLGRPNGSGKVAADTEKILTYRTTSLRRSGAA